MADRERAASATPLLTLAWRVLAGLSALLLLLLGVGFALPGTWSTQREVLIAVPPDQVFEVLDDLSQWRQWTAWSDVEVALSGPPRGEGATMTWDDPFAGRGTFRIVGSQRPLRLEYQVEVEGGASVRGQFALARSDSATHVVWLEKGDFGWNPLMSYAALTVGRVQGDQLEQGLGRLRAFLEAEAPPEPPGDDAPGGGPEVPTARR